MTRIASEFARCVRATRRRLLTGVVTPTGRCAGCDSDHADTSMGVSWDPRSSTLPDRLGMLGYRHRDRWASGIGLTVANPCQPRGLRSLSRFPRRMYGWTTAHLRTVQKKRWLLLTEANDHTAGHATDCSPRAIDLSDAASRDDDSLLSLLGLQRTHFPDQPLAESISLRST